MCSLFTDGQNFELIVGDQTNQPSVQSPAISLEEREAAYQAARERIFSERASVSPDTSLEQRETQRARPVPVVARRMIAHALGKPQVLTADSPPIEIVCTLPYQLIFNASTLLLSRLWKSSLSY